MIHVAVVELLISVIYVIVVELLISVIHGIVFELLISVIHGIVVELLRHASLHIGTGKYWRNQAFVISILQCDMKNTTDMQYFHRITSLFLLFHW